MANEDTSSTDIFIFTGSNAQDVPQDVTQIRVDPSVKEICELAFNGRKHLAKVELSQGLEKIGVRAFLYCISLTNMAIPSTVTTIEECAFAHLESLVEMDLPQGMQVVSSALFAFCSSLRKLTIPPSVIEIQQSAMVSCPRLEAVDLPDGLLVLGERALMGCESLTRIRVPPMIKLIQNRTFANCKHMLSIELPEDIEAIEERAFMHGRNLRNIFFASLKRKMFDDNALIRCSKLKGMFPENESDERLLQELENRFDGLPIHRLCYYQSYHSNERNLLELERIKLESSSSHNPDILGMTPLHILALSAKPNIELCGAVLLGCNSDLTVKDRWGCDPLGYACTSVAPNAVELIKLLVRSLLERRIESLGLERWRTDVTNDIVNFPGTTDNEGRMRHISQLASKLSKYLMMEKLSLLESALWKTKIDETLHTEMGTDRETCRLICGAQIVLSNVVPFLGPPVKLEDIDFDRVPPFCSTDTSQ
eukprot:scaffold6103_cov116-Cylindrotheca_fusiformis.AAC.9